eukprot:jgi/Ulvmu1/4659/UM002_0390.1
MSFVTMAVGRTAPMRMFMSGDRKPRRDTPWEGQCSCARHALHDSKRLGIFVSGGGSNFRAIHESCLSGRIKGSIVVVVTDVPTSGGAEYAVSHGIDVLAFPMKWGTADCSNATVVKSPDELASVLTDVHKLDFVLLAGYLKLVPPAVVQAFSRRMLNIHPGLLPAFGGKGMYGTNVHKAVIKSGSRYSGPTVHFVDENYDTGPILAQRAVPCYPDDTVKALAQRILKQEHELYPHAVAALCEGRIEWRDDGIPYIWAAL